MLQRTASVRPAGAVAACPPLTVAKVNKGELVVAAERLAEALAAPALEIAEPQAEVEGVPSFDKDDDVDDGFDADEAA